LSRLRLAYTTFAYLGDKQEKKTVAKLKENPIARSFDIDIVSNVSVKEMKEAEQSATVKNGKIVCPHCGHTNAPEVIRGDKKLPDETIKWGLREWENMSLYQDPTMCFKSGFTA